MLRKPRCLAAGDRVAVVAPAGPVDPTRLDVGLQLFHEWGLEVDVLPGVSSKHDRLPYLAGDDATRAKDFRAAWLDPAYKAVFCARGGYGVQRMLQHLDLTELTEAEPKLLVGFSDITALHEVFNAAGVVTIHGPVAAAADQLREATSRDRLRQLLFEPESVTDLLDGATTLTGGVAEGTLLGGNLALLAASLGTPTALRPARAVVVLEDVGEDAYRLDRLFTQLIRAGWFDGVTGVVCGDFSEADSQAVVAELLADRIRPLGIPTVTGASVGHESVNLALPLGVQVVLDADAGTLRPAEPPLSPPS